MPQCKVCIDRKGFFARPCPGCHRQKPITPRIAVAYGIPVIGGHLLLRGLPGNDHSETNDAETSARSR